MTSATPPLAPDAAIVLGIASTAMPFAGSAEAEAERWLRLLRLHGDVGVVLQALGVSEAPLPDESPSAPAGGGDGARAAHGAAEDRDVVARVVEHAARVAGERGGSTVATTDVLVAVMHVYGGDFDRVLQAHGTDRDAVLERLAVAR